MSPIERSGGGGGAAAGGLVRLFQSTLGAPAASIDTGANGIAAGHSDLIVYVLARTTEAVISSAVLFTLNGDAGAHYANPRLQSVSTTVTATNPAFATSFFGYVSGASADASEPGVCRLDIPSYDLTTFFKAGLIQHAALSVTAGAGALATGAFSWTSTAAINQITATAEAGNLVTGSRMVVYGTQ